MAPVLQLDGLCWSVGGAAIIQDVSLAVDEGELLAVIGPNGAGKTSLFNLISGLTRATGGRIRLDGNDITALSPHRRAGRGIGRTFQSSSLFATMTVAEHVELAARSAGVRRVTASDVAGVLARVRLAGRGPDLAAGLSHGDKRKLELAMLLAPTLQAGGDRARLMLLDEPMAGVASEETDELTDLIRTLHRDEGRTVLLVEHHMDVVLGLADRIAVMHHGRLLAAASPDAVMADATVQQAYLGDAL
ncbi:ABC transporter ATP-binding protein [Streptomyces sp. enrichment culture]|uniref:ABC transporter ATP-binding protein n=1 Tax=Streptomyces sp. enrichment culture TaxID=1795815 RepID=UPI003F5546EF